MKSHIICFGKDELLLQTRSWILERRFHVAVATSLASLSEVLEQMTAESVSIELLILCQTVPQKEARAATVLLRQYFPDARVLKMLGSLSANWLMDLENQFDPNLGPAALLERVTQLLPSQAPMTHLAVLGSVLTLLCPLAS
ncbi:MAG: hypothetical protein ABI142_07960 [Bryocella sp.]